MSEGATGTEGATVLVSNDNVVDAIADLIEADGVVNARVWADDAPQGATKPYVTITDAVATGPGLRGDGRNLMLVRQVQVDLWEALDAEDPAVTRRLWAALDGQRVWFTVAGAGATATRLIVEAAPRLPETSNNIAHRAFTLALRHDPSVI